MARALAGHPGTLGRGDPYPATDRRVPDRARGAAVSGDEGKLQARAWARLARAAARADDHASAGPAANRELFAAIEFAATEGRLDLRELVAAYLAGASSLDVSEAWEAVEDYLDRISVVHGFEVDDAFERAERALPDWRRRLRLRIAAHDLALAAHRALGGHGERIEQTRLAIADVLEGAKAADATEQELDAFVRDLRVEQCDVASVIAAAAWVTDERAHLAERRGTTLPGPSWATAEIARDRGVSTDVVEPLVEHAVGGGLLAAQPERGVAVTPAGRAYIEEATRP